MGKGLVEKQSKAMANFRDIERVAGTLFKSGLFNHLKNVTQAVAVIEFGREMDIQPMQALQMMAVINGKIAMASQLMLAKVKKQGCDVEIIEQTDDRCIINFIRDGKKHKVEFTFEEAKQLGAAINGRGEIKDNYVKQPANMLFWRVVSKAIRYYAPDLLLGGYSIEELTEGRATTVDELGESDVTSEDWGTKEGYDEIRKYINDPRIKANLKETLIKGINEDSEENKMIEWLIGLQPELRAIIEEVPTQFTQEAEGAEVEEIKEPDSTKPISQGKQILFNKLIKSHVFPDFEIKELNKDFPGQPSLVLEFMRLEIARRKMVEQMIDIGKLSGKVLKTLSAMEQKQIEQIATKLKGIEGKKEKKDKVDEMLVEVK